ncbi:hypothetical protein LK994_08475 [Ferruginibacter lapsinanis]|uniref:hypothetical protein n=1 Tax=Ferruginibacter lapsinanis TaxID=563172 RepID=UPI001E55AE0E|nr:hypothetical protein [Ferruginibacter lapsinanis]UEG48670.1 hypothetical protein LK994_08475 [Ferruginibacter lapsinanis]
MKAILRKYLVKQASLFPWLIVLLLVAMIYYVVIGIIVIQENAEGIMAFLIVPYLIPWILLLAGLDYTFRRILKYRLQKVWLIETTILIAWGAWYYHHNFYRTEFVTTSVTPIIVFVKDIQTGKEPERDFLQQSTTFIIPPDNILQLKTFLRTNEWRRLVARTSGGYRYKQIYPMTFMEKDTIQCGKQSYPIQFFILESEKYPHYRFDDKQFDSMRTAVCNKLQLK